MISKISNRMTQVLIEAGVILDTENELYNYGIFMIISYAVFLVVSLSFGIILKIPLSSVHFYLVFCLIRSFAGGIHAESEIKCDIITTGLILICEVLIKLFIDYSLVGIAYIAQIVSSACLCVIKPVASSQKEISDQERILFHKKVFVLMISALIVSTICFIIGINNITISSSMGFTLASFLLVLGRMKERQKSCRNLQKNQQTEIELFKEKSKQ